MARIIDYEAQNVVGEKVKKFREERKLSQKAFSEKLETYSHLGRAQAGKAWV